MENLEEKVKGYLEATAQSKRNDLELLEYYLSLRDVNKAKFVGIQEINNSKILGNWYVILGYARSSRWSRKKLLTISVRSYFDKTTSSHIYSMFGKDCYVGSLSDALQKIADKVDELITIGVEDFAEIEIKN